MILSKDVLPFLISGEEPMSEALRRLENTKLHVIIVVDDEGRLLGTFSDGDFRRWLFGQESPSLMSNCVQAANRNCVSVSVGTPLTQIQMLMARGLTVIPVLDGRDRVVSLARPRTKALEISGRRISAADPVFVIAEIGINHNGQVDTARRLVDAAAEAGADAIKFQLREMKTLYRKLKGSSNSEDLGAEYTMDLLADNSLATDELLGMLDYVECLGLTPLCTPWDIESAQILSDYGLPAFKVASADLTNHPLLNRLIETERPLIVSTGMSTEAEIIESVDLLRASASAYALMQCNSAYPPAFKDLNLRYMDRLADIGNCVIGYSGHERGHHVVLAAVARGARIVEKHITLDRSSRGVDHAVSLEPPEFAQMMREIRDVEAALGSDAPRSLTQGEQLNRLSLSKSLVAARDLVEGHHVLLEDVVVQSPGRGLQPNRLKDLLGKVLQRPLHRGQFFFEADLTGSIAKPRDYKISRPWGIPVRFHDWEELAGKSNPDLLEFHLSYRDMDSDLGKSFPNVLPYSLVVHSPDLFRGDLILDLASMDRSVRSRSIDETQRVVDLTHKLLPKFAGKMRPLIVVSMGGSSTNVPVPASVRPRLYDLIVDSMSQIDRRGIQILAQTLPPFPWYLGGQRYCNLFVEPEETAEFSSQSGIRLCLDVAHTKLTCNYLGRSFARAVEVLAPQSDHFHLVDASGSDAEGLQIGEGEIDWGSLVEQMARLAPTAGFIPEIWQGHVDGGVGFWIAMERLESEFGTLSKI